MRKYILAVAAALTVTLFAASSSRADGGASAVVVVYLKAECVSFASQAASNWHVSYGPVLHDNGDFEVTFKNIIRNGPGGVIKTTTWVNVKGNLDTGSFTLDAYGNNFAKWISFYKTSMNNSIGDLRTRWQEEVRKRETPASRTVFRYTTGQFEERAVGKWVEARDNGPDSTFRETGRTNEYIELYDDDRQLTVRLYNNRGEFSTGGDYRQWPGSEGGWAR